jgi:hypothetical protein
MLEVIGFNAEWMETARNVTQKRKPGQSAANQGRDPFRVKGTLDRDLENA